MLYNSSIKIDVQRARERLDFLIKKGKIFELTEKRQNRSLSQNRYLHLLFSWYAWEYGEKKEYVKQEVFKKVVNKELFAYEFVNKKTGEIRIAWKSTKEINTKEMTIAIGRFIYYASQEAGIYLPTPDDLTSIQEIERHLENQGANKWI